MKSISLIIIFLLMTSAIVPELARLERQIPIEIETPVIIDPYIEPYYITMNKMAIEQLKIQVKISLKEIEILNIH